MIQHLNEAKTNHKTQTKNYNFNHVTKHISQIVVYLFWVITPNIIKITFSHYKTFKTIT
jgi:hypothetical protein